MENIIKSMIKLKLLLLCENVENNNSGVPPPVTIKESSGTHSSTPAIVRVETRPSSDAHTRLPRFGDGVGFSKPNTQNFQESSSFDSTQENTWTVSGSWNKWYSGYVKKRNIYGNSKIADNMFDDDDVIIIYLVRMSECDEEEKILAILILSLTHSGDETCDLTFIMYLNILIIGIILEKILKWQVIVKENMQYQRKHYLSKYQVKVMLY